MKDKKQARLRRAQRNRIRISKQEAQRLTVYRSANHIYAQVITSQNGKSQTLACASTLDKTLRLAKDGKMEQAKKVGELIAKRALAAKLKKIAFDRSGFKYHGRVKALAEAARAAGLEF